MAMVNVPSVRVSVIDNQSSYVREDGCEIRLQPSPHRGHADGVHRGCVYVHAH